MTPVDFDYLLSEEGQKRLLQLSESPITDHSQLNLASALRKEVGVERTHALMETALLRQRAASKFTRAGAMYFDRPGLEMSSAEIVSAWREQRYAGFDHIADLGCGIGGDAIGLSKNAHVTAVDRDPLRLAMAAANLAAYGRQDRFTAVEAELLGMDPFSAEALFFDPARRSEGGKRIYSIRRYKPPLSILDRWATTTPHWGIKVSPGFDYAELPEDVHVEFISVAGELREAVFWYGDLRPGARRTATLLPAGLTFDSDSDDMPVPIAEPGGYLYEPDPAIIRAHLVSHLATRMGAAQIDSSIAYLTSDVLGDTRFARRFDIEDWFPFQLKRLRAYLRERNVGRVDIKKRGSAIDVELLRKQLRLKGKQKRIVFLTLLRGEPIVIVAA